MPLRNNYNIMHTDKKELKRVMYIIPRYHTNLVGSVKALQESGYEVQVLGAFRGATEDYSQIRPIVLPNSLISRLMVRMFGHGGADRPYYFPSFITTLSALSKFRPDLVVVRNPKRIAALFGIASAKLFGCRVVFYTQTRFDLWSVRKKIFASWCLSFLNSAWYSPLVINLDKQFEKRGFFFVPFAVEGRQNCQSLGRSPKVLMVGKYGSARKNHDFFIESILNVRKKVLVDALIVGEVADEASKVYFNHLQQRIDKLGANDYIHLKKNVDHSLMGSIYADSDIYVLPSSREPAAISVLEAIANGVPAVCSSTCGTRTYVLSGKCGKVFKDGCIDDLTESILEILSDKGAYSRYKQAAVFSSKRFSHEAFINALRHLYKTRWKK